MTDEQHLTPTAPEAASDRSEFDRPSDRERIATTDPVAILFPGQGSQAPGMGRFIYDRSEAARRTYQEASDIIGFDVSRVCFDSSEEDLAETTYTQPAVLTTSMSIVGAMKEKLNEAGERLRPRVFGGHSLGLFGAAVAAEALSFRDSLFAVMERSRLMSTFNQNRPVGMASIIGLDTDTIAQICEDATHSGESRVDIANHNLATQTVISGDVLALERAMEQARRLQGRVIRLRVKVSSHTPLHNEQAEEFAQIIEEIPLADPTVPIVSNRTSRLLTTAAEVREELEEQLRSPVYWTDNVRRMEQQGIDTFVEVGPGHVLARLVRRISGDATAVSLDDAKEDPVPISVLPPLRTQEQTSG